MSSTIQYQTKWHLKNDRNTLNKHFTNKLEVLNGKNRYPVLFKTKKIYLDIFRFSKHTMPLVNVTNYTCGYSANVNLRGTDSYTPLK